MEKNSIRSDSPKIIHDLRAYEDSESENESQNSDEIGAPEENNCSKIESLKPTQKDGCSCSRSRDHMEPEQEREDHHAIKRAKRLAYNQRRAANYRKKKGLEFRNHFGNYPRSCPPSIGPHYSYGNYSEIYPSPMGPRNHYGNYPKNYPSPMGPRNFNGSYPKSDPLTGFHDMYQKFATIYIRCDKQISPDDLCVISEF